MAIFIKNKIKNNIFVYFILFCLILFLMPFIFYFYNFRGGLSNISGDWNNLGGFVGGILGPLYSLINIAIAYYLTIKVKEIEEARRSNDFMLEIEKRRNELKLIAYKEIHDVVIEAIRYITNPEIEKGLFSIKLKYILDTYVGLFDFLEEDKIIELVSKVNSINSLSKSEKRNLVSVLNTLMRSMVSELMFKRK